MYFKSLEKELVKISLLKLSKTVCFVQISQTKFKHYNPDHEGFFFP